MDDLRLVVHQMSPVVGAVRSNEDEIRRRVLETGKAGLVAFPELTLTGYDLRSRFAELALPLGQDAPFSLPQDSPPVAVGLPERDADELVYNSAVVLHGNRILARHRKVYLPTYGMFDEGRYFAPGRMRPPVVRLPSGWTMGLLLCEDFWHPSLVYLLALQGADVIVVMAAAPGRGNPSDPGALFGSTDPWLLLARAAAVQYGLYIVIANRVGVEGGVTFAGESVVVAPDGGVLARAPQGQPWVLEASLSREALRRSRTPFAHLRDEDPSFLLRALERLESGSGRERYSE